jgi:WD40 repeat protein
MLLSASGDRTIRVWNASKATVPPPGTVMGGGVAAALERANRASEGTAAITAAAAAGGGGGGGAADNMNESRAAPTLRGDERPIRPELTKPPIRENYRSMQRMELIKLCKKRKLDYEDAKRDQRMLAALLQAAEEKLEAAIDKENDLLMVEYEVAMLRHKTAEAEAEALAESETTLTAEDGLTADGNDVDSAGVDGAGGSGRASRRARGIKGAVAKQRAAVQALVEADDALVDILCGHELPIHAVAFTPDGAIIASGGHDCVTRLWQVSSMTELAVLSGHEGTVEALAFSPDGKLLVTASFDHTLIVWDVASSVAVGNFVGHRDAVWGVGFSPCGSMIASAGEDHTVRVWNVADRSCAAVLDDYTDVVFGAQFSPMFPTILATACGDKVKKVWCSHLFRFGLSVRYRHLVHADTVAWQMVHGVRQTSLSQSSVRPRFGFFSRIFFFSSILFSRITSLA